MTGGVRILLVDDDRRFRERVAERLERLDESVSVTAVGDAAAALDRLASAPVDCVVSDYRMPGTDGLELAERVRESWPSLPFVLVTGRGSEDVATDAFSAGASEYFRKGDDTELLLERIHTLVEKGSAERSLRRAKERYEALVEASSDLIATVAPDGTVEYHSESLRRTLGVPPDDVVGESVLEHVHPDDRDRTRAVLDDLAAADAAGESADRSLELRLRDTDGDWRWIEATARTTDAELIDGVVVNSRDVTERRRRETTIRALHDATRDLIGAPDRERVEETTVEAAADVLDLDLVTVYRFDDEAGRLVPAVWTDDVEPTLGVPPTYDRGESLTWAAFASGETRVFDDVREAEGAYEPDTPVRSELIVPLGTHGVFVSADTAAGTIDDVDVEAAETLCASAEAAIDQLERRRRLADRERTLDRTHARGERLDHALDLSRTTLEALVAGDSREDLEAAVCGTLARADPYRFAWVGRLDATGERLEPATHAGVDERVSASLDLEVTDDPTVAPAARAAATGEVTVVDDALEAEGVRREDALRRDYRSVAGVPLVDDGYTVGAAQVYAADRGRFDDLERGVLADVGRAVGAAVSTVDRRASAAGDFAVEAAFNVDCETLFHWRLSRDLGCTVRHMGTTGGGDDRVFVELPDATPAAVRSAAAASASAVQVVTADPTVVQVRTAAPAVLSLVRDHGGRLRSLTVDDGSGTLEAAFVRRQALRRFADAVERYADDVELLRCETVDESAPDTTRRPVDRLRDRLTDRQRELLQAAYFGGYFDRDRGVSGEDLAETFDLNHSTVYEHLRAGQRTLLAALFDRGESDLD